MVALVWVIVAPFVMSDGRCCCLIAIIIIMVGRREGDISVDPNAHVDDGNCGEKEPPTQR